MLAAAPLELAEQAWARRGGNEVPARLRGESAFLLARILSNAKRPVRDRTRAKALAEDALRSFQVAEDDHRDEVREVEQWLERRAP
jgi:hypothetical protein